MTKYSKIKKSSFAILALSLILVAVLAFGGTYAYFTDKATATDEITMATLGITEITLTVEDGKVVPGQDVLTAPISFKSDANTNAPMIMLAKVEIAPESGATIATAATVNTTWEAVTGHTGYYAYKGTGYKTAGAASENFTLVDSVFVDRENGNDIMGKKLTVTVTVWAMQAEYVGAANGATATYSSAADVYTAVTTYYGVGGAEGGPSAS